MKNTSCKLEILALDSHMFLKYFLSMEDTLPVSLWTDLLFWAAWGSPRRNYWCFRVEEYSLCRRQCMHMVKSMLHIQGQSAPRRPGSSARVPSDPSASPERHLRTKQMPVCLASFTYSQMETYRPYDSEPSFKKIYRSVLYEICTYLL